jgi:pimeloyl-ACP methyl ester carboxylesterase
MRSSVSSRGHLISYRSEGSGTPLVLLGGHSAWADEWWDEGYVDQLRDGCRVIAIDRLGHGESDKPSDPAEYLDHLLVADIIAVLDAEQVETAVVWGYSMGSRNATSLAIIAPGRVSAVVNGGGAPLPDLEGRREQILAIADAMKTDDAFAELLRGAGANEREIEDAVGRNDLAALRASWIATADDVPSAEQVVAPSLWYRGSADAGGFDADTLDLASRLGVETYLISDADHITAFTRAADVLEVVKPFINRFRN